jgi:Uma2 family endonuclease
MVMSEQEYLDLVLREPNAGWELIDGCPRREQDVTTEHGDVMHTLYDLLIAQLYGQPYVVRMNWARARRSERRFFLPDVCVIPTDVARGARQTRGRVEYYDAPLALVVEVWSRSTGDFDLAVKLPTYQERGDREIWFVHPYERWLRAWRRQPDGRYVETRYDGDVVVEPAALAGVRVELARLFAG